MRKQVNGYIRLVRSTEFFCFVIITTLVGAASSEGVIGWQLAGVLVANWLAVAFAFMINDVADARDDALTLHKYQRNPVSCADLSPRAARVAAYTVASLAVLLFAILGWRPLLTGLATLFLGHLYSAQPVRFKDKPLIDLVSHGLMLAGLQFLAAFFTFQNNLAGSRWFFPFLFVVAISLYGELFNELRDLEGDRQAGLNHTACWVGARPAYYLMMGFLALGSVSALAMVFWVHLFPTWVLILLLALAVLFNIPHVLRAHPWKKNRIHLQQSFHKPLEMAAALALLAQFSAHGILQMMS